MKICFLADAQNVHTQKWTRYFADKNYDVHLITFQENVIPGVKVYPVKLTWPVIINHNVPVFTKSGYFMYENVVKKLVKSIKPDILHAHWATSYGYLGARTGFHPYIISTWGRDVYKATKGSFFYKKLLRYSLNKADMVTATSHELAGQTQKFTKNQVNHIPFGVDIDFWKPSLVNKTEKKLTIGIVKKLEPYYGVEYLIKAFHLVLKNFSNVRLVIIGDGSEKKRLENLTAELKINDYVEFLGLINHKDLPDYYRNIDIFVVPSLTESFGVVVVEAASCGLPVIASNVNGLPETVIDGETGFLVPPQNPQIIAEKILYLINNSDIRKRMGRAARTFVEEYYVWEKNAALMEKLYLESVKYMNH